MTIQMIIVLLAVCLFTFVILLCRLARAIKKYKVFMQKLHELLKEEDDEDVHE